MVENSPLPWSQAAEEAHNQLEQIRAKPAAADVVAWILGKIADTDDLPTKIFLLSELAGEYGIRGDSSSAEKILRERVRLSNEAAQSWIGLAEHYHYAVGNLTAAQDTIDKALQQALREGAFVRQAAGVRIRISLARADYGCVEETLRLLLTDAARASFPDVGYETDFLQRIPDGAIDANVLRSYQTLSQRQ